MIIFKTSKKSHIPEARLIMLLFTLLFLKIFALNAHAEISTSELEITKMYNNLENIYINAVLRKDYSKYELAIDYSVEILKKPNTIEAICALPFICHIAQNRNGPPSKFKEFKEKYYSNLNDYSTNMPEKIILAYMMLNGVNPDHNHEEFEINSKRGLETLLNMKDNCSNNDYAVIVFLILMGRKSQLSYEFFNKYPNHQAIPWVNLNITIDYYLKDDTQKAIKTAHEMIEKYKNIMTPSGHRFVINYYNVIVRSYIKLNDYANAKKYLDLIEKEVPNYWYLSRLRPDVEKIKN